MSCHILSVLTNRINYINRISGVDLSVFIWSRGITCFISLNLVANLHSRLELFIYVCE